MGKGRVKKNQTFSTFSRLVTIYMGKLVGPRFRQMVRKIPNLPKGLKLISKMALKKWNTNFHVEYSIPKNRTTFSDVPLLPVIFCWNDQKGVFHLLSNRIPVQFLYKQNVVKNSFFSPAFLKLIGLMVQ